MIFLFILTIIIFGSQVIKSFISNIREKEEAKRRVMEYKSLIVKFNNQHQIVADYYMRTHLSGSGYIKGSFDPWTKEGLEYQKNMKQFFGKYRAKFPGSGGFEGYGWGEHDYTPLEDLKTMYDSIEKRFPEAFISHNRTKKLEQLGI